MLARPKGWKQSTTSTSSTKKNICVARLSARRLVSDHRPAGTTRIDELMERERLFSVDATDDQERVAQIVAQYDLGAIPVVDNEHHLLGIITHDDVIDVVREEAAEDVYRMGAVARIGRKRELLRN